jgi:hypothetical protein
VAEVGSIVEKMIIAIIDGIIAATRDEGQNGVAYITALMHDKVLAHHSWQEHEFGALCIKIEQECFGRDSTAFVRGLHRYCIENEGIPAGKLDAFWQCWDTAFFLLDHEAEASLRLRFEAGCLTWLHINSDHRGRVLSFVRRLIPNLTPKEIGGFIRRLGDTPDSKALARQLCAALFEFHTSDPVELWFDLSDAFTGKFTGFVAWKRAQEIIGEVKILRKWGTGEAERLYTERVRELRKLMNDAAEDVAKDWLNENLDKAA